LFRIAQEGPLDGAAIEALLDGSFGPRRQLKISYRYRVGRPAEPELSMVAWSGDVLVGSIRYWRILAGTAPALLLGPLAIDPARRGQGIGRALTWASLGRAQALGWPFVLLVGDLDYYAQFGFARVASGVIMPGEAPHRLLGRRLDAAELPTAAVLARWSNGVAVAAVEAGQEPPAQPIAALDIIAELPRPYRQRLGNAGLAGDPAQGVDQSADGERHPARRPDPAARLVLDA
jgi:predicted N-acetyltransferase YhbS